MHVIAAAAGAGGTKLKSRRKRHMLDLSPS
jgi:hypothetical protein